jgi:hypothetical protein
MVAEQRQFVTGQHVYGAFPDSLQTCGITAVKKIIFPYCTEQNILPDQILHCETENNGKVI